MQTHLNKRALQTIQNLEPNEKITIEFFWRKNRQEERTHSLVTSDEKMLPLTHSSH